MNIFSPGMRALVISPHTDDAELCCGGTISVLGRSGVEVDIYTCGKATGVNPQEPVDAAAVLGVTYLKVEDFPTREFHTVRQDLLEEFRGLYDRKYDIVFIPSLEDTHQDHSTVAAEAFRAFKHGTLISWEAPWNNLDFSPNFFCPMSSTDLIIKVNAISQYQTQKNRYYFKDEYIMSWARMRGGQVNRKFAEAFKIVRMIV